MPFLPKIGEMPEKAEKPSVIIRYFFPVFPIGPKYLSDSTSFLPLFNFANSFCSASSSLSLNKSVILSMISFSLRILAVKPSMSS